jgi:putative ABC transport system substrate-binding protein
MASYIERRKFLAALGGAAVAAWPLAARAQQRTILPQVGILDPGIPQHFEAFRRGMRDLGYVEGNSISYIYRTAAGRVEPVSQFASELVALKPDVIVTASAVPVRAVKEATSTIPIVFVLADAITAGVVNNLAHPGENLTGLSFLNTELSAKRLDLLLEMLPNIRRIAVLRDLNTPRIWAEATEEASRRLGLAFQLLEVAGPETFESAYETAVNARAEALDVLSSAFFNSHKGRLTELAAKYRLPTMYEHDDFVRIGGLIAYGPSIPDLLRRAATHVDKILKGAKPGDLPIEQPTKFDLVINLKTAKALGLQIPDKLLAIADKVIE